MRTIKQGTFNSRSADKFVVRLPDGMRTRIDAMSRIKHRSMNSQVLVYLSKCLDLDEADQFELLDVFAVADADPKGSVIAVKGPSVPYATNIPVMYGGHVWIVEKLVAEDGVVYAELERTDTNFEYDNGRHTRTVAHSELEPFCA